MATEPVASSRPATQFGVDRCRCTGKRSLSSDPFTAVPSSGRLRANLRATDFHSSPSEPFPRVTPAVSLFVSRLRGRAVRRTSHDSMSLGRFRFGGPLQNDRRRNSQTGPGRLSPGHPIQFDRRLECLRHLAAGSAGKLLTPQCARSLDGGKPPSLTRARKNTQSGLRLYTNFRVSNCRIRCI